jgi:hypothetical protein
VWSWSGTTPNGAPDPRWDDEELATMRWVTGRSFEVVRMNRIVTG